MASNAKNVLCHMKFQRLSVSFPRFRRTVRYRNWLHDRVYWLNAVIWSRVLLEKLMVKKFPAFFFGTISFTAAVTTSHHWLLFWTLWIWFAPSQTTYWRQIFIFYSEVVSSLWVSRLKSYMHLTFPICVLHALHTSSYFSLINLVIFVAKYKE
jgi:hypothetical protein